MPKDERHKQVISSLKDLSETKNIKWDIYDTVTLVILVIFLAVYFAEYGIRSIRIHYLWGDFGWWHEQIRRFAQGETPYKDFVWGYPPFAIYFYGWLAKAFGDSFLVMRLITMTITVLIALTLFLIARQHLPKKALPILVIASMIMAVANSHYGGETLALGMYTPTIPLGILLSLICLFSSINYIKTSSKHWAYIIGFSSGGMLLTKQDFWLPALVCIFLITFYEWQERSSSKDFIKTVSRIILPFLILIIAGYGLIFLQAGFPAFEEIAGLKLTNKALGVSLPNLINIIDSFFHLAIFTFIGIIIARLSNILVGKKALRLLIASFIVAIILGLIRFGITYWIGNCLISGNASPIKSHLSSYFFGRATNSHQVFVLSVKNMIVQAFANIIPLFLAFSVGIVFIWTFWKYRESKIVKIGLLLAFWIMSARMRRLFERIDVLNLLIEPLFLAIVIQIYFRYKDFNRNKCDALIVKMSVIFLIAGLLMMVFYDLQQHFKYDYRRVKTAKGTIEIPSKEADELEILTNILNSIDPSGNMPLLQLPFSGALNYIFDRDNPNKILIYRYFDETLEVLKDYRGIVVLDLSLMTSKSKRGEKPKDPYNKLLESMGYKLIERPDFECQKLMFQVYVSKET